MTAGGSSRKSFLRRALTENIGLKVLALAASVGLFVIVSGDYEQRPFPVDVVVLQPPPSSETMLVSEVPDQVQVTLQGSRSVLNSVRRSGLPPIQMDLQRETPRYYDFARDFDPPAGTSVVQIVPSSVTLEWASRAERRVRVQPLIEGEVAPGYSLGSTTVEPGVVRIRGVASEVNSMDRVWTAGVDVTGLTAGRHERRVPLGPLPRHVTAETPWAVVTINVEEENASRTLRDLEVAVIGGSDARVRPSQVNVVLRGPRTRVDDLQPRRVIPYVDVTALDPSRGAQPVPVGVRGVPEGVTATVEPSEVLVTLPVPAR